MSADIIAGNPHDDLHVNKGVWHFHKGEMNSIKDAGTGVGVGGIPPGSLLAKWKEEDDSTKRAALASQVHALLAGSEAPSNPEDVAMLEQLRALASSVDLKPLLEGLEPDPRFEGADLKVTAPSVMEFTIPVELARGSQLEVTGTPDGANSCVQLWVSKDSKPDVARGVSPGTPISVNEEGSIRARFDAAFDAFRAVFPIAVCYERVVPIDKVVTLQLWHREDRFLRSLILDDTQMEELDRLWEKLY